MRSNILSKLIFASCARYSDHIGVTVSIGLTIMKTVYEASAIDGIMSYCRGTSSTVLLMVSATDFLLFLYRARVYCTRYEVVLFRLTGSLLILRLTGSLHVAIAAFYDRMDMKATLLDTRKRSSRAAHKPQVTLPVQSTRLEVPIGTPVPYLVSHTTLFVLSSH